MPSFAVSISCSFLCSLIREIKKTTIIPCTRQRWKKQRGGSILKCPETRVRYYEGYGHFYGISWHCIQRERERERETEREREREGMERKFYNFSNIWAYMLFYFILFSIYEQYCVHSQTHIFLHQVVPFIKAMHASISTTNFKSSIIKTYAKCQNLYKVILICLLSINRLSNMTVYYSMLILTLVVTEGCDRSNINVFC